MSLSERTERQLLADVLKHWKRCDFSDAYLDGYSSLSAVVKHVQGEYWTNTGNGFLYRETATGTEFYTNHGWTATADVHRNMAQDVALAANEVVVVNDQGMPAVERLAETWVLLSEDLAQHGLVCTARDGELRVRKLWPGFSRKFHDEIRKWRAK